MTPPYNTTNVYFYAYKYLKHLKFLHCYAACATKSPDTNYEFIQ